MNEGILLSLACEMAPKLRAAGVARVRVADLEIQLGPLPDQTSRRDPTADEQRTYSQKLREYNERLQFAHVEPVGEPPRPPWEEP
jgi:hypothetical protein